MMMDPKYEVPIVPLNLRREETIIQIAEALSYLNDVSADIFQRVNDRIKQNNDQVKDVSERLNKANAKIKRLSGSKNATQVFSSSKYPATDVNNKFISIFSGKDELPMKTFPVKYKNVQFKDEPLEKLQFYHVKVEETHVTKNNIGLGDLPNDIDTVNDLLLYNTGKNPYNKYVMSDTLKMTQGLVKRDDIKENEIGAAPHSITDGASLTKNVGETYFYTPNLGDVPTINVPIDLPDLPGIADDLRYVTEIGPGIAPSVNTSPIISESPQVIQETTSPNNLVAIETEDISPISSIKSDKSINASINLYDASTSKDVSIPEIDESITNQKNELIIEDSKPLIDVSISKKDERKSPEIVVEAPKKKKVIQSDDARASLMDQIRKAGGSKNAKLKISEQIHEPKTTKSSGDLMADLHAKLSMRRKGISGNKMENGGSAMDKVSAMIPAPLSDLSDKSMTTTEDDDWED